MATDQQRRRWSRRVLAGVGAALVVQVLALVFTRGALEVVFVFGPWLAAPPVLVATVPLPRPVPGAGRDQPLPVLVAPFAPMITYLVPVAWIVLRAETALWATIIAVAVAAAVTLAATVLVLWLRLRRAGRERVRVIQLRRAPR